MRYDVWYYYLATGMEGKPDVWLEGTFEAENEQQAINNCLYYKYRKDKNKEWIKSCLIAVPHGEPLFKPVKPEYNYKIDASRIKDRLEDVGIGDYIKCRDIPNINLDILDNVESGNFYFIRIDDNNNGEKIFVTDKVCQGYNETRR